ncbi:MAG: energy transducer TonB [Planctomycetota bacterium]
MSAPLAPLERLREQARPARPSLRQRLLPHAGGLAVMLLAAPATLAGVLALNRYSTASEAAPATREVSFQVEPPAPKPKAPPKRRAEPRRQARAPQRALLPPPPSLGPALSGVDLGLDAFKPQGLAGVADAALGDLQQVVHTEETVDRRPQPRVTTPIEVPAAARSRNLSGRLLLSLLIGKDGRVRQAKVLEAEPAGVFDAAALSAVRTWEFEPATYRGEPVEVWAALPIQFQP